MKRAIIVIEGAERVMRRAIKVMEEAEKVMARAKKVMKGKTGENLSELTENKEDIVIF